MFFKTVAVAITFIANKVLAAPNGGSHSTAYLANFDDLASVPGTGLAPVGAYDGLYWNDFVVTPQGADGLVLAGIIPQSSPNTAAYGIFSELNGEQANITSLSGNTFGLTSLYYACAVNTEESAAAVAVACTITATVYLGPFEIGQQSFSFTPAASLSSPMMKVVFNKFGSQVTEVVFTTANSLLIATVFDNIA